MKVSREVRERALTIARNAERERREIATREAQREAAFSAPSVDSMALSLRLPAPDLFAGMNGTERARAIVLEARKRDGQIRDWRFEQVTLKLAPDCRYTPDMYVVHNDGSVEFEECKGFWRDDAKVKIRVAARLFPEFKFTALRLVRGAWEPEEYRAA